MFTVPAPASPWEAHGAPGIRGLVKLGDTISIPASTSAWGTENVHWVMVLCVSSLEFWVLSKGWFHVNASSKSVSHVCFLHSQFKWALPMGSLSQIMDQQRAWVYYESKGAEPLVRTGSQDCRRRGHGSLALDCRGAWQPGASPTWKLGPRTSEG